MKEKPKYFIVCNDWSEKFKKYFDNDNKTETVIKEY